MYEVKYEFSQGSPQGSKKDFTIGSSTLGPDDIGIYTDYATNYSTFDRMRDRWRQSRRSSYAGYNTTAEKNQNSFGRSRSASRSSLFSFSSNSSRYNSFVVVVEILPSVPASSVH